MELKIRQHIEALFASAPKTAQAAELKEEIIRNTIERYHDLLSDGKSESEAYSLAIENIGDISELIDELGGNPQKQTEESIAMVEYDENLLKACADRLKTFRAVAVGLYILCVTPTIMFSNTPIISNLAPSMMFFMISAATALLIYSGKTKYILLESDESVRSESRKRAIFRAVGVGLFISCVTPPILLSDTALESISPVFMFLMIAAGVVLCIFSRGKTATVKKENIRPVPNAEAPKRNPAYNLIIALIWVLAVIFFFVIICVPAADIWTVLARLAYSWLVFPIAAALHGLTHALFDYKEAEK